MIKQKKIIVITGIICLVLMVYLAVLYARQGQDDSERNKRILQVEGIEDLKFVSVKNAEGEYEIVNTGQGYDIPSWDYNPNFDNNSIIEFLCGIIDITADRTINANNADLSEYGLDNPTATVSIGTKGGELFLSIGKETGVPGAYFARIDKNPQVYIMSGEAVAMMLCPVEQFVKIHILGDMTNQDMMELTFIRIYRKGKLVTELSQIQTEEKTMYSHYFMSYPVESPLDRVLLNNRILSPLKKLIAEKIMDGAPSEYGLDSPTYTLELDYKGETVKLRFTDPGDGDYSYSLRESDGRIFKVEKTLMAFVARDYTDILGESVYVRNVTTVSNIEMDDGVDSYSIDIAGQGGSLHGEYRGRTIKRNDLMALFLKITEIPSVRKMGESVKSTAEPVFKIKVTLRDGAGCDFIEFIPVNDRQSAVRINGIIAGITVNSSGKAIMNEAKRIIDLIQ